MTGRWFRFYEETLNDPKVLRLTDAQYRGWVGLLTIASMHDGALPPVDDIALFLRTKPDKVISLIVGLVKARLLDKTETGYEPHNWGGRQYKSDSSSSRVAKYREARRNSGLPILGDYSKFRDALIDRDGERCVYCEATTKLVVDHMTPVCLGGTDDQDNLALACRACNSGKAGRTPEGARMVVRVASAASALRRYRDNNQSVTVTETPPEQRQNQKQNRAEGESARTRPTKLDPKWSPSDSDRQAAAEIGLTRAEIESDIGKFRDHYVARGETREDWSAQWRSWCRKTAADRPAKASGAASIAAFTVTAGTPEFDAWKAHFSDAGNRPRLKLMNEAADKAQPFTVPAPWPPGHAGNSAAAPVQH